MKTKMSGQTTKQVLNYILTISEITDLRKLDVEIGGRKDMVDNFDCLLRKKLIHVNDEWGYDRWQRGVVRLTARGREVLNELGRMYQSPIITHKGKFYR